MALDVSRAGYSSSLSRALPVQGLSGTGSERQYLCPRTLSTSLSTCKTDVGYRLICCWVLNIRRQKRYGDDSSAAACPHVVLCRMHTTSVHRMSRVTDRTHCTGLGTGGVCKRSVPSDTEFISIGRAADDTRECIDRISACGLVRQTGLHTGCDPIPQISKCPSAAKTHGGGPASST